MADLEKSTRACNFVAIDIAGYWNAVLVEIPGG